MMVFQDFLPLFPKINNSFDLFRKNLFNPFANKFLWEYYKVWDKSETPCLPSNDERRSLSNLFQKQSANYGGNIKRLIEILKCSDHYIAWVASLGPILKDIPEQKLECFIRQVLDKIFNSDTHTSFILLLKKLYKLQNPQAKAALFGILVIYSLVNENLFHKHCTWLYDFQNEKLTEKIYEGIVSWQDVLGSDAPSVSVSLPLFSMTANYYGYETEFEDALRLLAKHHCLFLSGIGGIGKTQFALRIAQHYKENKRKTFLLTYETSLCRMLAGEQFSVEGVSRLFDGTPESDADYAIRKLSAFAEQNDENTLLIIDNFDAQEDPMLNMLLGGTFSSPSGGSASYSLLITTRNDFSSCGFHEMKLTGLDVPAQRALFCKYFVRRLTEVEDTELPAFLRLLFAHPLTIELVAKLMYRKGISIAKMTEILSAEGITPELQGNVRYSSEPADTVFNHLRKVFRMDSLTEAEKQILIDMTLLPVKGISPALFCELCGMEDSEPLMVLHERSWILYDSEKDLLALHPLIADVVLGECTPGRDSSRLFLMLFSDKISETWTLSLPEKEVYFEIAQRILARFPETDQAYLPLYSNMGVFATIMEAGFSVPAGNDEEHHRYQPDRSYSAFAVLNSCLKYTEAQFGDPSVEIAEAYYRIAAEFANNGERGRAEQYIQKAIMAAEQAMPDAVRTAFYVKYHAWIMLNRPQTTDYPRILTLLHKTERILARNPSKDDPYCEAQNASLKTAYAAYYYHLGQYEDARNCAVAAYKLYSSLFGGIHADTVSPLAMIALIYSKTNNPDEAIAVMQDVIRIVKLLFPERSQVVLLRYQMLADIYANIGQMQNAVITMKMVCQAFESESESLHALRQHAVEKLVALEQKASSINSTNQS